MGHALALAQGTDLTNLMPSNALASTQYCLANPGHEYLVYLPFGNQVNVNLSAVSGFVSVEWFNPNTNQTATGSDAAGGAIRTFASPFGWKDVVLHLRRLDDPNEPPSLNLIGNKKVTAGNRLQFTVSASDPNPQDTLRFSAANLPPGASFISATRTFSWTTDSGDLGTYDNLRFFVRDNGDPPLSDSETITITVVAPSGDNQAPVLDPIGDMHIEPGDYLDFSLSVTDPDPSDWVSFRVDNLPAGAQWWPGARRVTWATTAADAGVYSDIVFTVTDHGVPPLSDSETITIFVGSDPADVNGDGAVDASDLQAVINALLGHDGGLDCDINDDNVVDALDVQLVTNAVLGVG
jgi:hypothetical protein